MDSFLSTGEAARILDISRSTVSRRFDSGQLEGKLNPITGERLIARKSIEETIRKHNLPFELPFAGRKQLIVGTSEADLAALVDQLTVNDARIETSVVTQGSDILISCARNPPDLLIVSEQLPDLRGSHVIRSLRKTFDMADMKILHCGEGLSNRADAAATLGVDACIDPHSEEERAGLQRIVYELLGLSIQASLPTTAHEHKRRWPRFSVDVEATLTAMPLRKPANPIEGRARISNISRGGAYLTNIVMDQGVLPGEAFHVVIASDQEPFTNWSARCEVVRLQARETLTAGVLFEDISDENRRKISTLQAA